MLYDDNAMIQKEDILEISVTSTETPMCIVNARYVDCVCILCWGVDCTELQHVHTDTIDRRTGARSWFAIFGKNRCGPRNGMRSGGSGFQTWVPHGWK